MSIFNTSSDKNFQIISCFIEGIDPYFVISDLINNFDNLFLLNIQYNYKYPLSVTKKTSKYKFLLYGNYQKKIESLPFISNSKFFMDDENIYMYNYKANISSKGDMVLLKDNINFINNKKIEWNNNTNEFVKNQIFDQTFLSQKKITVHDKEQSFSHLIICRYLINDVPAIHVNYIVRKGGMSDSGIQCLIGFLNYIKTIIHTQNIIYFSIAGNANLYSAQWQNIIYKIFQNSVYISPGIEQRFITTLSNKNKIHTSEFMIISKTLAPFGVYFYLMKPKINYISNKFILVGEILTKNNRTQNTTLYKNDNTGEIYYLIKERKKIDNMLTIDQMTSNDINLNKFDFNLKNEYEFIDRHVACLHINDVFKTFM